MSPPPWDRASQKFLGDSNAVHDCELSVALPAQKEAPQAAVLIRVKHDMSFDCRIHFFGPHAARNSIPNSRNLRCLVHGARHASFNMQGGVWTTVCFEIPMPQGCQPLPLNIPVSESELQGRSSIQLADDFRRALLQWAHLSETHILVFQTPQLMIKPAGLHHDIA